MARLPLAMVFLVVGCGDAGDISSDHWGGVGGNDPGSPSSSSSASADASTPPSQSDASAMPEVGPQTSEFVVTTDKTSYSVELRNTVTVQVSIAPQGFSGSVNLSVMGLPTDVSGAFSPSSVSLMGTTAQLSTLTLTTLSTAPQATTPFMVVATAGSAQASATPMLQVLSQITVSIPSNLAAVTGTSGMPSTDAYGAYPIVINAPSTLGTGDPVVVKFLNLNSTAHCIHASNPTQGFPHDPTTNGVCTSPFGQNQYDSTAHNINAKGSYVFWLHDQGDLTDGEIMIQ